MRKTICFLGIVLIIAGLCLVTGCAQKGASPTKAEDHSASADSAIINEPGHYEDKNIGYSVNYLADIFNVENELEERDLEKGIVLFREYTQKVPSIVIRAQDKPAGVPLEEVGEWFKEDLEAFHADSDRFKVVESNMVKLQTGVDANATLMKWRYQGAVPVYTAVVIAYKNDKAIFVYTTSVPGQPPADDLMKMAMALKVNP